MGRAIFFWRIVVYSVIASIIEAKTQVPLYETLTLLLLAGVSYDILTWQYSGEQEEDNETEV